MDDISQTAYRIRSRECFPQRTNVRSVFRRGRGSRPWPLAAPSRAKGAAHGTADRAARSVDHGSLVIQQHTRPPVLTARAGSPALPDDDLPDAGTENALQIDEQRCTSRPGMA